MDRNTLFQVAFQPQGEALSLWGQLLLFEQYKIGDLWLPSGILVARDPFSTYQPRPFTLKLPVGKFPVTLSIACFPDNYELIAFAKIEFQSISPKTWYRANSDEPNPIFSPYQVDSGFGAFLSLEAAHLLCETMAIDKEDVYLNQVLDQLALTLHDGGNVQIDPSGLNAMMFMSGQGDGDYRCYWGYAEDNTLVCLVNDFNLCRIE
jgi:hypothetical protein